MSRDIETRVQIAPALILLPFGTVSAMQGEDPLRQVSSITEETFETPSTLRE